MPLTVASRTGFVSASAFSQGPALRGQARKNDGFIVFSALLTATLAVFFALSVHAQPPHRVGFSPEATPSLLAADSVAVAFSQAR